MNLSSKPEEFSNKEAREMLKSTKGNRNLNEKKLKFMIDDMINKNWHITSTAIGIDENGCLADGHHRLEALSRCPDDVKVTFLVVRGIKDVARQYQDIGTPRNPKQQQWMNKSLGELTQKEYNFNTEIARAFYEVVKKVDARQSQITDFYKENFEAEHFLLENLKRKLPAPSRAMLVYVYKKYPEQVKEFVKDLSNEDRHKVVNTYLKLLEENNFTGAVGRKDLATKTLSCLLAYIKDQDPTLETMETLVEYFK